MLIRKNNVVKEIDDSQFPFWEKRGFIPHEEVHRQPTKSTRSGRGRKQDAEPTDAGAAEQDAEPTAE